MIKLYDPIFDIFRELAETHLQCVVCSELFVDAVRLEKVQGNFLMIWGKKMKNIKRHVKKNWILFTLNLICSPLFIISPNWANKTLTKYLTSGEKNFKSGRRVGVIFQENIHPWCWSPVKNHLPEVETCVQHSNTTGTLCSADIRKLFVLFWLSI